MRGFRRIAEGGCRFSPRHGGRGILNCGPCAQARETAGGLANGPGGSRRQGSVLLPEVTARIAVEQASTLGWETLGQQEIRPHYRHEDVRRVSSS
jgi:hypothetical protein